MSPNLPDCPLQRLSAAWVVQQGQDVAPMARRLHPDCPTVQRF